MSNIEEDIKILESMLEEYYSCSVPGMNMHIDIFFSLEQAEAIENILVEREVDKKRIKELEDRCKEHQVLLVSANNDLENSIPIQKVKDKMEKLNKEIKNGDEIEAIFKIKQQQILAELLEDK